MSGPWQERGYRVARAIWKQRSRLSCWEYIESVVPCYFVIVIIEINSRKGYPAHRFQGNTPDRSGFSIQIAQRRRVCPDPETPPLFLAL
jgi:hypothetical protein